MLLLLTLACDLPEPAPPGGAAPTKPECSLSFDTLGDTVWLYPKPQADGSTKPDPTARLRFRSEGGALKADYTAGSVSDVYKYDCTVAGSIATCLETDPHIDAFCKAYAASHDGVCDPAAVAAAIGAPVEEVTKVSETVNAELKKLKGEEITTQRKMDNSPNNKLRSVIQVAVDKAKCGVTIVDKYQTMVDGRLNQYENQIGTAKFVKSGGEEYIWESCKDADSAWAPGPDDKVLAVQTAGTIKFASILQKDQKGAASCSYTADVYVDWVKKQGGLSTTDDKQYGPRWNTEVTLGETGKHVVYFDRYKECDGKKDRIGISCAMVRIE